MRTSKHTAEDIRHPLQELQIQIMFPCVKSADSVHLSSSHYEFCHDASCKYFMHHSLPFYCCQQAKDPHHKISLDLCED